MRDVAFVLSILVAACIPTIHLMPPWPAIESITCMLTNILLPTAYIVNATDTIIGGPLFTVPFRPDGTSLCFEVQGSTNQIFNLISDQCTTVNAHFVPMNAPRTSNVIDQIGVRAQNNNGSCNNIRVELEGCRAFFDGSEVVGSMEIGGVHVRRVQNSMVRISVPNCQNFNLVMWANCRNVNGQDMIHFSITQGLNLQPTSHGLLGQCTG